MGNVFESVVENTVQVEKSPETIVYAEMWMRPLRDRIAAAFGAKHSFLTLRTEAKNYFLLEKLCNGVIELKPMTNREYIKLKTNKEGIVRRHVLFADDIKKGVTLTTIRKLSEEHKGHYHIHDSNCHKLSASVWNHLMKASKLGASVNVPQLKLSKAAKSLGIGTNNGSSASASLQVNPP